MITDQQKQTGLYPNAADYHQWSGLYASNSILSKFARSPKQAWDAMQNPEPPTPAMRFGSALHCLVLEPRTFDFRYRVSGECTAIQKNKEPCVNSGKFYDHQLGWLCGKHSSGIILDESNKVEVITPEDGQELAKMDRSVRAHPAASKLLAMPGETEVSAVFRDIETGVLCKMRMDRLCRQKRLIWDLKTTSDASPEGFASAAVNFGYFRQSDFYMRGCAALGIEVEQFAFVPVEKETYEVAVYVAAVEDLELAHRENTALLLRWKSCVESNHWPGYSDVPVELRMPAWARKKLEEKLL